MNTFIRIGTVFFGFFWFASALLLVEGYEFVSLEILETLPISPLWMIFLASLGSLLSMVIAQLAMWKIQDGEATSSAIGRSL